MPVNGRTPISRSTRTETGTGQSGGPLIVELVGPAGAGKTALLRTLGRDPRIRTGIRIERVRHLLEMLVHAAVLLPTGLALLGHGPTPLWYGLLHFVRLRTLPRAIARASRKERDGAILLDEGPIFSLGRLSVFQQASQGNGQVAQQWRAELNRWTKQLDAVVWVDAADPVLIERIRSRRKEHRVKSGTADEATRFLDCYRRAYAEVLSALRASGKVRVVEINTTDVSIDGAAGRVLTELERLGLPRTG
jgi:hypothetical protein